MLLQHFALKVRTMQFEVKEPRRRGGCTVKFAVGALKLCLRQMLLQYLASGVGSMQFDVKEPQLRGDCFVKFAVGAHKKAFPCNAREGLSDTVIAG
jgi:hypothetical protein